MLEGKITKDSESAHRDLSKKVYIVMISTGVPKIYSC